MEGDREMERDWEGGWLLDRLNDHKRVCVP